MWVVMIEFPKRTIIAFLLQCCLKLLTLLRTALFPSTLADLRMIFFPYNNLIEKKYKEERR